MLITADPPMSRERHMVFALAFAVLTLLVISGGILWLVGAISMKMTFLWVAPLTTLMYGCLAALSPTKELTAIFALTGIAMGGFQWVIAWFL